MGWGFLIEKKEYSRCFICWKILKPMEQSVALQVQSVFFFLFQQLMVISDIIEGLN
jgi:hypothetical protein